MCFGQAIRAGASPNANLEDVSDWLTKIIVGLTLVNLGPMEKRVHAVGHHAAAALHASPTDSDISSATALVIGLAVVGWLVSYLHTRLFLQGAFSRSDAGLGNFDEAVSARRCPTSPPRRPVPASRCCRPRPNASRPSRC
jgi:hypothetical protein